MHPAIARYLGCTTYKVRVDPAQHDYQQHATAPVICHHRKVRSAFWLTRYGQSQLASLPASPPGRAHLEVRAVEALCQLLEERHQHLPKLLRLRGQCCSSSQAAMD